jgi:predicted RNA-binding Zn-ribbon protein involved in translation (DUF1610 family)
MSTTEEIYPDTEFDLQCINCGTITSVRNEDALLTCPCCGIVELHVAAIRVARRKAAA